MVTRKYVKDYRLDDTLDKRGRIRSTAIYVGGDYSYIAPEAANTRRKKTILLLGIACWLFFLGALLPHSHASRTMYCVLPFAACSLPLLYESTAVAVLWTASPPFRRDQADKLSERLPISALLALILSGAAFVGFCVTAVLSWDALSWGDAVFAALCAAFAAASGAVWRTARYFRTEKTEPE